MFLKDKKSPASNRSTNLHDTCSKFATMNSRADTGGPFGSRRRSFGDAGSRSYAERSGLYGSIKDVHGIPDNEDYYFSESIANSNQGRDRRRRRSFTEVHKYLKFSMASSHCEPGSGLGGWGASHGAKRNNSVHDLIALQTQIVKDSEVINRCITGNDPSAPQPVGTGTVHDLPSDDKNVSLTAGRLFPLDHIINVPQRPQLLHLLS